MLGIKAVYAVQHLHTRAVQHLHTRQNYNELQL